MHRSPASCSVWGHFLFGVSPFCGLAERCMFHMEDMSAEVTVEVTEEVTVEVTVEVTAKVTEEVTEEVTAKVTEEVTEEVTAKVTEDFRVFSMNSAPRPSAAAYFLFLSPDK
ncbi:hypothetical protein EYF80_067803 [Liparis tanakae]|uniref:Uncharacterized protein n=1 Tax=Liparis tanakae TaxID=230148 RepID=A0A4Z2DZZ6_9TELE|nr:hypothetical protein EYF80_067803 [Liparis tanakae]